MADDVPISFFPTGGLYLKTLAILMVEVRLPEIRNPGLSVSNWEIMEKIKEKSKPVDYQNLRVSLSARELIRFEGEFETVRALRKVSLLLNGKSIKISGFPDPLRLRAYQSDDNYPTQVHWEGYFSDRGVTSFDDGKPGERADTVHIKGLPVRWFSSKSSNGKPCPKVLTDAFQKFGKVRQVGFYDPSSSYSLEYGIGGGFSSFGPGASTQVLHFEAYIQYEKYSGFISAMEGLKNMQLLRLQAGGQATAKIKVDYDHNGFLSERGIRRRRYLEEKERKEREEEERLKEEQRREEERRKEEERQAKEKEEEMKRLRKQEEKKEKKREQEALAAQLREVAVQRRTEALRLMSVLLARAAETRCQEELREKEREAQARKRREEIKLRDELIHNVEQLEQRRIELQRELRLRKSSSSSAPKKKRKKTR